MSFSYEAMSRIRINGLANAPKLEHATGDEGEYIVPGDDGEAAIEKIQLGLDKEQEVKDKQAADSIKIKIFQIP